LHPKAATTLDDDHRSVLRQNSSANRLRAVEIAPTAILALQKLRCYNGIMTKHPVHKLTDEELLDRLAAAAALERQATANLIALLAEMDTRGLYLARGYSSLFAYCTRSLHLSEHAAYGRIEAARAARRYPDVLDLLTDGSITATTVCLLASHLTPDNHRALLESARHKSKREVEHLIAAHRPLPPVRSVIRKLPKQAEAAEQVVAIAASVSHTPSLSVSQGLPAECASLPKPAPPVIRPLAPERYKVQLTIDRVTHDKLRTLQDLLRHVVPNGDPAIIFDRALTALLANLERTKIARVDRPREAASSGTHTRHVPAAVRREVWKRDKGQCAFEGADGRCGERGFLEFHPVVPFADGGETSVANLQLRCRAHNAYEASQHFGVGFVREQLSMGSVRTEFARMAMLVRDADYGPERRVPAAVPSLMQEISAGPF
jgi:hypothetical protein